MSSPNDYDAQVEAIREYNAPILSEFQKSLEKTGLSKKTVKSHVDNIDFFTEYLMYYEPLTRLDEADEDDVSSFLLDWFPRKALWASVSSTKSYLTSFKKFFQWMGETQRIPAEVVDDVLEEVLDNFVFELENGYFFMWKAVVCEEKGVKLNRKQKKLLDELLYFSDNDNDQILYIDETPRPKEAWYEIARKIVPRLLVEPFRTDAIMYAVMHEGWANLVNALEEHAQDLSLPEGIESTLDIFPHDLQHHLWLQTCFDALSGLGQGEDLTLENKDQQHRVEWFIDLLREHKDTVQYLDLTLETMLTRVIIPSKDEKLFTAMIMEQLGLPTSQARIAEYL